MEKTREKSDSNLGLFEALEMEQIESKYSSKEIKEVENHPTSKESFEPLKGITVLLVAEHENPENYRVFVLDKPVVLKKGIWHQVMALTPEAQVKITENLEVPSEFYEFEKAKTVCFGEM